MNHPKRLGLLLTQNRPCNHNANTRRTVGWWQWVVASWVSFALNLSNKRDNSIVKTRRNATVGLSWLILESSGHTSPFTAARWRHCRGIERWGVQSGLRILWMPGVNVYQTPCLDALYLSTYIRLSLIMFGLDAHLKVEVQ